METKFDQSFGIIPLRKIEREWKVFLIHQYSRIGNNTYWVLPKGHAEVGESEVETAIRELKEETGFVAEKILEEPAFSLQYKFIFDGIEIAKKVTYFIGLIPEGEPQLQVEEVREAGWFGLDQANDRLDYQNTKDMFVQAKQYIEQNL